MKLFHIIRKKEENAISYEMTYVRTCECCGRTFKATYRSNDYFGYMRAKDTVDSYFYTHSLFCGENAVPQKTVS